MYTGKYIKIYNWQKKKQVYKTYEIVKFEKYLILRVENLLNLID